MAKRNKSKSFSQRCLEVPMDTIMVVAFATAAAYLINLHFLSSPTVTNAVMFP